MVETDEANKTFLAPMFAGKHSTVCLHAPKVASGNGTADATARTNEWKIPLTDLVGMGSVSMTDFIGGGPNGFSDSLPAIR